MSFINKKEFGFELNTKSKMNTEYMPAQGILVCTCIPSVISEEDFKSIFEEIGEMVKHHNVKKLIFDKRALKVFDQTAMEWYHVVWKKEMALYGLKTYRKLLPENNIFKMSVEIGRKKITEKYPDFSFDTYDIQYCDSIEEAIER